MRKGCPTLLSWLEGSATLLGESRHDSQVGLSLRATPNSEFVGTCLRRFGKFVEANFARYEVPVQHQNLGLACTLNRAHSIDVRYAAATFNSNGRRFFVPREPVLHEPRHREAWTLMNGARLIDGLSKLDDLNEGRLTLVPDRFTERTEHRSCIMWSNLGGELLCSGVPGFSHSCHSMP